MRIKGWEVAIGDGGNVRTANHGENGSAIWINGRLIAHADVPQEVIAWLIRPQLRQSWDAAVLTCVTVGTDRAAIANPYNGEPPNKDKEAS